MRSRQAGVTAVAALALLALTAIPASAGQGVMARSGALGAPAAAGAAGTSASALPNREISVGPATCAHEERQHDAGLTTQRTGCTVVAEPAGRPVLAACGVNSAQDPESTTGSRLCAASVQDPASETSLAAFCFDLETAAAGSNDGLTGCAAVAQRGEDLRAVICQHHHNTGVPGEREGTWSVSCELFGRHAARCEVTGTPSPPLPRALGAPDDAKCGLLPR